MAVEHHESLAAALVAARKQADDGLTVVIEKHRSRRPDRLFKRSDTYVTVGFAGNPEWLKAWGWEDAKLWNL